MTSRPAPPAGSSVGPSSSRRSSGVGSGSWGGLFSASEAPAPNANANAGGGAARLSTPATPAPSAWYAKGSLRKVRLQEDEQQGDEPVRVQDLVQWYQHVLLEAGGNLTTVVVPEKHTPGGTALKTITTGAAGVKGAASRGSGAGAGGMGGDEDFHFKPVLPPVSIKDFEKFFATTRARTKIFLENHTTKRRPGAERDWETGFNLPRRDSADTRIPTEEASAELLRNCYASVPEQMFSAAFNAVGQSKEVEEVIEVSEAQRRLRQQGGDVPEEDPVREVVARHTSTLERHVALVEKCLWLQTTTKADTIFQAVSNLHSLQSMVKLESSRVTSLRGSMKQLRDVTTSGREHVLALNRERANSVAVRDILDKIKRVSTAKATCDKLIQGSDYMGAFEVIENASHYLQGELAGVQALKPLARQLKETRSVILNEMAERFVSLASMESQNPENEEEGVAIGDVVYQERLRDSLAPLIRGLFRNGTLRDALSRHREKLIHFVNLTGRALASELLENVPADKKPEFLAEMDHAAFVEFLQQTFDALHPIILHAAAVHSALTAVIGQIQTQAQATAQAKATRSTSSAATGITSTNGGGGGGGLTQSQKDEIKEILSLSSSVVFRVREKAFSVVTSWLKHRDGKHARISVTEFLTIWNLSHDFITESGGEPALELKQALARQADRFLSALDERQVGSITLVLNNDTWESCAVARDVQLIVARFARNGVATQAEMDSLELPPDSGVVIPGVAADSVLRLQLGNRALKVTEACQHMIRYMYEYTKCASLFHGVAPRSLQQMLAALELYNGRTYNLILRAEARNLGRMQKIGAKHLALASQSITAVAEILPMCGRIFAEIVPPQQRARVDHDVRRTVDMLKEHVQEIATKMADLIGVRVDEYLGNLERDVEWDATGLDDLEHPRPYMVKLTNNITSLHDVLSLHMDRFDVTDVFARVFAILNAKVPVMFQSVRPKTPAGRTRVRVDVLALLSCCRRLRSVEGPGDTLEVWLEERYGWNAGGGGGGGGAGAGGGGGEGR